MSLVHIGKTHPLTLLHTLRSFRHYRDKSSMAQNIRTDEGVLRVIPPPGQEAL